MKVRVTASAAGYTNITRESKSHKIAIGTIKPATKLTISGAPNAGSTISASVKLPAGTKSSYQWYKNGKKIKKATNKRYKLSAKDVGAKYQVRLTVTAAGYHKLSISSNTVKIGNPTFAVKSNPKISGTAKVGQTLKATTGSYSPKPSSYSYQWLRGGKAINKATKSSYKLTGADSGQKISVKVTAKKKGYVGKSATSNAVSVAKVLKTVIKGDGTYKVSGSLKPGLYKATGKGSSCYWARLKGFSGEVGDINSNYFGSANAYVRIKSSDKGFETRGCGSWQEVPSSGAKATSISKDGIYRVGIDIKPGLYSGKASDMCYWAILRDFSGDSGEIIANDLVFEGSVLVEIPASAKGFEKSGCGTLKRVG